MADFELPREARSALRELEQARLEAEAALELLRAEAGAVKAEIDRKRTENERAHEVVEALLSSRVRAFGLIADAWAEYEDLRAQAQAEALRRKAHPAKSAATEVRAKGKELAEARRRAKLAEWVIALYEWHFPWLVEFRDLEAETDYVVRSVDEADENEDPASRFLSADEWAALSSAERNQLALERYLRSRMTPWQLGRDYERYVGYLREQAGCSVTYHGIVKGFEDLGRDILAERDGVLEVIQCKRWAQHKEIHEKHVFQLFGTMVAARIENPSKRVIGTLTTTTRLSERAREFARVLDIRVEESFPIADYPRIKCNVALRTDERIYHLPFDQQYDSTVIEANRAERYVATAAEAEALGFRRAWRWRASTTE